MTDLGRMLMFFGIILFALGVILVFAGRIPGLGHLPGDIRFRRGNLTIYAPIGTMLLLSILLTVILNILARLHR